MLIEKKYLCGSDKIVVDSSEVNIVVNIALEEIIVAVVGLVVAVVEVGKVVVVTTNRII